MKILLVLIFAIKLVSLSGQIVEGVDLSKYPAKSSIIDKKARIKWHTNPFKTKVKEIEDGYATGAINFAGYYIVVLWEKGRDTVQGVMIDLRTGIIYNLPINSANTFNQCDDVENIFDRYLFLPTSKLFVTSTCKKVVRANEHKTHQVFYFYLWNEAIKKFSLIKQSTISRLKT